MTVRLNHTFVPARDPWRCALDLAEALGLGEPERSGPFPAVRLADGLLLEFAPADGDVRGLHYAFEVTAAEFDAILARLRATGRPFWAGPLHHGPGVVNRWGGGRGFYFDSLDGHSLEVLTLPAAGGAASPQELAALVASAYAHGDAETALRLFEPGARLATRPGETVTGTGLREAIAGFLGGVRRIDIRVRHIYEADGIALILTDHVTELDGPDGGPVEVTGTATDVARRGPDGRWRYLIDNPGGSS
ncbi:DUF4440 domain-containing protein [Dactylosporangium sp. CA-233914]|uniref:DUF4440 domain-containing protein n=1 Tax=Dactylosporangium sp. CA-233914 TaxID=3239934 RepID=UPI003D94B83D